MRRRQSVRGGVWCMGGRRKIRRQTGRVFPIGALAALILGTLGSVVIKKLFGSKRLWRWRQYV